MEQFPDWALEHLIQQKSTGSNIKKLQLDALGEVILRFSKPTLAKNPLKAGAKLALMGKSNFKLKALRSRLVAANIEVTNGIKGNTTHILLGRQFGTIASIKKKTLLLEKDLQAFLDEIEKPYLQQEEDKTAHLKHLVELLFSGKPDFEQIALGLLEGGGFPIELVNYIFVACKTNPNQQFRATLRKYLHRYLSTEGQKRLNKTYQLKGLTEDFKVQQNILKYTLGDQYYHNPVPADFDGLQIARLLFRYYKIGFCYIWSKSPNPNEIKRTLSYFIQQNTLNLKDKGIRFVPKELSTFKDLEVVDLSLNNHLKKLPYALLQLPKLKKLNLYWTEIEASDPVLKRLKGVDYTFEFEE